MKPLWEGVINWKRFAGVGGNEGLRGFVRRTISQYLPQKETQHLLIPRPPRTNRVDFGIFFVSNFPIPLTPPNRAQKDHVLLGKVGDDSEASESEEDNDPMEEAQDSD